MIGRILGLCTLAFMVVFLPVGGTSVTQATPPEKPNILLVVADDMSEADWWKVGALREVAGGGTFFNQAFVTTSLCCPSRATTLTGLYSHNHGITQHIDPGTGQDRYQAAGFEANDLSVWLRNAGYDTVLVRLTKPGGG